MRIFTFLVAIIIVFSSCKRTERPEKIVHLRGEAFGTYYAISYYCSEGIKYNMEIDSILSEISNSMSYYDKNSTVSKINRNETNEMDDFFKTVLKRSFEIYENSDGAFDVTVSPIVNAWGFGFAEKKNMTRRKTDSILQFVGLHMVNIEGNKVVKQDPRIQFDFNAIAKGYGTDLTAELLKSKGVSSFLVDIGGDLMAGNVKPDSTLWRIAIERPAKKYDDPQEFDYIVEIENLAIATSGNYRRYYEQQGKRYSHTINPKTGYPVDNNLLSVTVMAKDCMTADAYATAFMVMGKEKAKDFVEMREDLDAIFIFSQNNEDFGIYVSEGFNLKGK